MQRFLRTLTPLAFLAVLLGSAASLPVSADEHQAVRPGAAQSIQLGYVTGIAYYTAEDDGYRVVATLSVGGGAPLRVSTILQPEQAVSFSVPGMVDADPGVVEIARRGDRVILTNPERLVLN